MIDGDAEAGQPERLDLLRIPRTPRESFAKFKQCDGRSENHVMEPKLLNKYGLDAAGRQERKDFLSLTPRDEEAVRTLKQWFAEIVPQFTEGFYRHLLAHPRTEALLRDERRLDRLKQEQMRYFEELVSGDYGEEYFERRLRVGKAHNEQGLEPQWYLGAYNLYIQLAFPEFAERLGGEIPPELLSLLKVILLDVGLALETYFAEATEQLRRRNGELEQALALFHKSEIKARQYAKLAGHEIRSWLNGIAHACEEVVEDFGAEVPAEALQTLEGARQRCWQVIGVVERILSEPERAGRPERVSVSPLLEEVAGRLNLYSSGKPVEFIRFETPVEVWADPIGLREVFANLVSNAVHHLDKEPGRVAVEYLPSGRDHVFCVADNGPGVPAEVREQIFEPFYRAPGSETSDGRGLGLYFVRQIVRQHGGRAWVESVPGNGSRFYFTLPKESLRRDGTETPTR